MVTTIDGPEQATAKQRDALVGRLFQSSLASFEVLTIYLGERLGLYEGLAGADGATPPELAAATHTAERYVREWLEQQAVAGILEVDDSAAEPDARRYRLPSGHAEVLLGRDSLAYLTPLARFVGALGNLLPALIEGFRTGEGVPYSRFGPDAREAQADLNRPHYLQLLTSQWLPSIPDVHARLLADPPARVADIGCGAGWSSIAIAQAYPHVRVDGFDLDEPSVRMARANAAAAGVSDRVAFHVGDAADLDTTPRFDLVTAFEMVHDLGRPVESLRGMASLLEPGGSVLVMDERVAERFTAPGDEIERFFYSASVLFCLPTGLADGPHATGTVMRPDTLRRYAAEAGLGQVEVLPIEHDFWRFYRLAR